MTDMAQRDDPADGPRPADTDSALPETVLEHLGRRLRSELRLEADKPAFLGDEALPPRFMALVRQIERREISYQAGLDAIRREFNLPDGEA
ncbi:MAG: hypothetical protein JWR08_2547 [Enterovirga sp.]|jgi:hypothetical protein|nr:hypothetical protein [Enterovirga sp.]